MNEKSNKIESFFKNFFKINDNEINKIKKGTSVEWDSLKHVHLILEIEKQFKIKLNYQERSNLNSYNDLNRIISNAKKNN